MFFRSVFFNFHIFVNFSDFLVLFNSLWLGNILECNHFKLLEAYVTSYSVECSVSTWEEWLLLDGDFYRCLLDIWFTVVQLSPPPFFLNFPPTWCITESGYWSLQLLLLSCLVFLSILLVFASGILVLHFLVPICYNMLYLCINRLFYYYKMSFTYNDFFVLKSVLSDY